MMFGFRQAFPVFCEFTLAAIDPSQRNGCPQCQTQHTIFYNTEHQAVVFFTETRLSLSFTLFANK